MSADDKEVNSKKRKLYMALSIQGHWNAVQISKDVIRVLGSPSHICLRVNEANHSLAICPCDATEVLSFKTPDGLLTERHTKLRIHSRLFIKELLQSNGLDAEKSYSLSGTYSERTNAVVFSFNDILKDGE
jgi:hypothetical protein